MSHTLQLEIPDDVYECLIETARQIGQSHEVLAVEWLVVATHSFAPDPLERFIGAFSGKAADWADNHDGYIGKAVMETGQNKDANDGSDV